MTTVDLTNDEVTALIEACHAIKKHKVKVRPPYAEYGASALTKLVAAEIGRLAPRATPVKYVRGPMRKF